MTVVAYIMGGLTMQVVVCLAYAYTAERVAAREYLGLLVDRVGLIARWAFKCNVLS